MTTALNLIWLVAAVCFLLSLSGLARQETARRSNWLGIAGIALAIAACFWGGINAGIGLLIVVLAMGGVVGAFLATRMEVTSMPQLTAVLHSLVSMAVVLVGLSVLLAGRDGDLQGMQADAFAAGAEFGNEMERFDDLTLDLDLPVVANVWKPPEVIHRVEIFLGIFLGGLAFAGSLVAWGKLDGRIASKPLVVSFRHWINVSLLVIVVLLSCWFMQTNSFGGVISAVLLAMLASFLIGAHLVMAINAANMSVVVSLLNSCVGFAVAAVGFALSNDLLIITGALVGSSGAVLACSISRAMNLSLASVVFGSFETDNADRFRELPSVESKSHNPTYAGQVASMLEEADEVVIVPGYDMAVSQAQHQLREVVQLLQVLGTRVRFAVHPLAGRMPGQMHVLLAEAGVPYDLVFEMDEINNDFQNTDLVLVIGANDIVNPVSQVNSGNAKNALSLMEVWRATEVVVFRRSMEAGVLGAENPLFYLDNTQVLLGDAKNNVDEILSELEMI